MATASAQVLRRPKAKALHWQRLLRRKPMQRRVVRYSIVGINVGLLLMVAIMVLSSQTSATVPSSAASVVAGSAASPLDLLSSADVAVSIANVTNLPEATAVKNQADSVKAELAVAPAEDVVAAKSQVVATSLKNRQDIQTYVTQPGDSVTSLAAKFDVTSNSIRWSNNIAGDTLATGTKLLIPPVNGIVYAVKAGDTPQSLASKYGTNVQDLINFNDAEISGLTPGEQIVIPNGQVQQASLPSYSAFGGSLTAAYGSNGYDFGFCTWYVANRRAEAGDPVPSNLGNAFSWYQLAVAEGLSTGFTPKEGAVMVYSAGDHVAYIEQVNPDGSFWISEMNDYGQVSITNSAPTGGWDVRDFRLIPASQASNYRYIY